MNKKFKIISVLLIFSLLLTYVLNDSKKVSAQQFESRAESAILMDAVSGQVLYEKNADKPMPPASITKIMTLLLAFEALERNDVSWDEPVKVSERAWGKEGSTMFLELGREVEFGQILMGISIVSANDGCVAVAEHLCGSEEAFVQLMNSKATELGLTKSKFKNSHGLPENGHVMSARDIAVLSRELITKYPRILEIESQTEFTYDAEKFAPQKNRNPLLDRFPGADGLKTGWTDEAGYCLVGTAKQDNMRLISVVLRTKDEEDRLLASTELLNYGFNNFEQITAVEADEAVGDIKVKKGKEEKVEVCSKTPVELVIKPDDFDKIEIVLKTDKKELEAPVKADTLVGTIEIRLDDKTLATADAYTKDDVAKAGFFELLLRIIINFFKSLF